MNMSFVPVSQLSKIINNALNSEIITSVIKIVEQMLILTILLWQTTLLQVYEERKKCLNCEL